MRGRFSGDLRASATSPRPIGCRTWRRRHQVRGGGPGSAGEGDPDASEVREFGDQWLVDQMARRDAGEMSPRTYEIYERLRRHVFQRSRRGKSAPSGPTTWSPGSASCGPPATRRIRSTTTGPAASRPGPRRVTGAHQQQPPSSLTSAERPKPGRRRRFLDRDGIARLLKAAPGRYRVAYDGALRASRDGGRSWQERRASAPGCPSTSAPAQPQESRDRGRTWKTLSLSGEADFPQLAGPADGVCHRRRRCPLCRAR